jgi:hypothetical protein
MNQPLYVLFGFSPFLDFQNLKVDLPQTSSTRHGQVAPAVLDEGVSFHA